MTCSSRVRPFFSTDIIDSSQQDISKSVLTRILKLVMLIGKDVSITRLTDFYGVIPLVIL